MWKRCSHVLLLVRKIRSGQQAVSTLALPRWSSFSCKPAVQAPNAAQHPRPENLCRVGGVGMTNDAWIRFQELKLVATNSNVESVWAALRPMSPGERAFNTPERVDKSGNERIANWPRSGESIPRKAPVAGSENRVTTIWACEASPMLAGDRRRQRVPQPSWLTRKQIESGT